jgi:hypothetical protein
VKHVSVVRRVSTRTPMDDLVRRVRADLDRRGTVMLLGSRSQAHQLHRLQGALCAAGYDTYYFADGKLHTLTASAGPSERTVGWWGGPQVG